MSGMLTRIREALDQMRAGHQPLPEADAIAECVPVEDAGYKITKDDMYFSIWLNQVDLADNRQWWSIYDPMIIVEAEVSYGRERVVIPRVIGPDANDGKGGGSQAPNKYGTVLKDTVLIGPYPYRGGKVDVRVRLFSVERKNYARSMLGIVRHLSDSVGAPGEMATFTRTGLALADGVGALLGLEETKYLAGLRFSATATDLNRLNAGFSALIAPPTPPMGVLRVNKRRLEVKKGNRFDPYGGSDFVLFSIAGSVARGDENVLPFYRLKDKAMKAVMDGEKSWGRAKATLLTAYQEMTDSPDLTRLEAGRLFDKYVAELEEERRRLDKVRNLGKKQRDRGADEMDAAAARLGL